jgi:hypothetical protein
MIRTTRLVFTRDSGGFPMKKSILLAGTFATVLGITTVGIVAAGGVGPQDEKQKPAAKSHTMTGCLEKGADATTFRLTNVEGGGPKTVELHADEALKLTAHVGHKVAITGVEADPKSLKKEAKPGEHHMKVDSMKHVAPTCP